MRFKHCVGVNQPRLDQNLLVVDVATQAEDALSLWRAHRKKEAPLREVGILRDGGRLRWLARYPDRSIWQQLEFAHVSARHDLDLVLEGEEGYLELCLRGQMFHRQ
jgi:hypothetical protein